MKFKNVRQWSTEKISQRVFYCLLGLAALVFALFFLVGYDMPFEENPDFNAPLFTNVLLFLMWALFVLAFCLAVYSIVNSYRKNASKEKMVHGIPGKLSFGEYLSLHDMPGSAVHHRNNAPEYEAQSENNPHPQRHSLLLVQILYGSDVQAPYEPVYSADSVLYC